MAAHIWTTGKTSFPQRSIRQAFLGVRASAPLPRRSARFRHNKPRRGQSTSLHTCLNTDRHSPPGVSRWLHIYSTLHPHHKNAYRSEATPSTMRAKIFGLQWQSSTSNAITMLEDYRRPYDFIDIGDTGSSTMDAMVVLSGETELPQLFSEGVAYVGLKSIQEYCRK